MKIKRLLPERDGQEALKEAARIIHSGGLVAFPTETVYGLAAHAFSVKAVEKVYRIKGRPSSSPLTLHFHSIHQVDLLAEEIPHGALKLMEAFWPGPLTIVLRKKSHIPEIVTSGTETVGLRIPDHKVALDFLKECGVPVVAPSANISGRPAPTNADMVISELGDVIDGVLDAGETDYGIESTVIDLTGNPPVILRPGVISREEIESVLEEKVAVIEYLLKKGLKPRFRPSVLLFYSKNPVEKMKHRISKLVSQGKVVLVLSLRDEAEALADVAEVIVFQSEEVMAKNFFSILRNAEEQGKDAVVVDTLEPAGRLKEALLHRAGRLAHEVWDD